ncbi:nitrate- and nitrite sensing domain-containing protein [Salinicola sp. JS01]|uniref:nitrate regulatory protein n=1 Tax=Salinicola sp. JS01 TaxID=3050071 RepID=UPI00255BBC09|nr:nitrate regulatory protein [Salinicola sp. JS01]WIX31753.1 nitrate- and nitrite sensing domain-containing protein [Salinicola sp. JS01]
MTATRRLLQAASKLQREQLAALSATVAVVSDISRCVHALQRERGSSIIYLGSGGSRFGAQRDQRVADSELAQATLEQRLAPWTAPETDGALPHGLADVRMLLSVAAVWQDLDTLPDLRQRIATQQLSADDTLRAFNQVIGHLLQVIFEAADTASDPDIMRRLVSLFHFIQGKELAGQERACGALGFTLAHFDAPHRDTMATLIGSQHRCFATFAEFTSPDSLARWQQLQSGPLHDTFEALRELACSDTPLARTLDNPGEQWYAVATQRIDAMHEEETRLLDALRACCHQRLQQAEPTDTAARLDALPEALLWASPVALFTQQQAPTGALTLDTIESRFNRSLVELVQAQNARLQRIGDELESTRQALRERREIERAKGLLMTHQQLSEAQAYRLLRKTAMDQSKPLIEVARNVIQVVEMFDPQG